MWTAMPHENGHSHVSLYIQSVDIFCERFIEAKRLLFLQSAQNKMHSIPPSFAVQRIRILIRIREFRVQTSAARPDIVTEVFFCFSQ
jgi:hypothetical protein